ncbi:type II toxin-antitoxin system RelE/ParE family toxin [Planktothrix sp. FACHB-1355]|uniref:Type II toxin-antitoxin system RelE/ParE family toxin n=1 Tax=Aerosakkonema funiforme FACHB-1375 TaxID=2949571 RepID=A0A926V995_9CYAN|nr:MULTISPECIES: type II toxin-antitoxin system RelE/ParE family toxin [Oscillatoriales]MBD2179641.1 type II toxin-antitoxin system RelE/ParE family toxin [Aerosakkonema funiforme FACHB-1375]MBD3559322.1 type II toxin-antitoxin system RelE/ParE family toxin [Planktothrix sp. FACHB-1355]
MTRRIAITPRASLDLDEHFSYIAENNQDAALRFFDAARQTFSQLAKTPGIGSPFAVTNSRLEGLRKWAVRGFEKYLIFYLDRGEDIEIVRVLHSSRNIPVILGQEE